MTRFKGFLREWIFPPGIASAMLKVVTMFKPQLKLSKEDCELLNKNIQLKDRHKGLRCFVLGGGSSVNQQDISKLKGELVISVSNVFVHQDFSKIKPKYHVLPPLLRSHGKLHSEEKFVDWLCEMEEATGSAEMVFHIGDKEMITRNQLFKGREIHWVEFSKAWDGDFDTPINLSKLPPIWSVSELALTLAVYLGFDSTYLIGIDHDWFNGLHIYFFDHKKEHKLLSESNNDKLNYVDSEFQMRRHAEIFKKYKYLNQMKKNIYNANANAKTYVDVFPKVEFDSLFK